MGNSEDRPPRKSAAKVQANMAKIANIIAFVVAIAAIWYSQLNYNNTQTQIHADRHRQDSLDRVNRLQQDQQRKENERSSTNQRIKDEAQNSLQRQTLENFLYQSKLLFAQLQNQQRVYDDNINSNAPKIDLQTVNRRDSTLEWQRMIFSIKNTGNRRCYLYQMTIAVVNTRHGYDRTFPIDIAGAELDFAKNYVQSFTLPKYIAESDSTLFYVAVQATDEYNSMPVFCGIYLKNPRANFGSLNTQPLNNGEIFTMNQYIKMNEAIQQNRSKLINKKNQYESQSIFNRDYDDNHLVLVSNASSNHCYVSKSSMNKCWKDSIKAKCGDTVSLAIYFHNCGDFIAKSVVVGLSPKISRSQKVHIFSGVLGEDNGVLRGKIKIVTDQKTIISFIPKSLRYYPEQSLSAYTLTGENYLFGINGINVGDIKPGLAGQGVLTANFIVSSQQSISKNR